MIKHKPLYQAMKDAVSQTLENMVFMEVTEHYDQSYEIPAEELTWAYLVIQDPVQAEVRLALPKTLLEDLTTTVFSLEAEEITQAQMDDILHELLNTITGLFMTRLLDDNQTYKIGLPERGEGELPEVDADSIAWKLMTSDEAPLQIFVAGASLVALSDSAE